MAVNLIHNPFLPTVIVFNYGISQRTKDYSSPRTKLCHWKLSNDKEKEMTDK